LAIISVSGAAAAQDMPPILAPLTPPAKAAPDPAPAAPSAEAVIPPTAPVAPPVARPAVPPKPQHAAAAAHPTPAHRNAKPAVVKSKFAALMKQLGSPPRGHRTVHRVASRKPEPSLPPGMVVPPPGDYAPPPYQRLVYGGPPGAYGGWGGYRGRYPNYP
jgi:hypothetical protein